MLKKLLIFNLYFYFACQWVDADDGQQRQRELDKFIKTYVEESDDGVPTYEFAVSMSNNEKRWNNGETLSIRFNANNKSTIFKIYPLKRNVMSRTLQCWSILTNYIVKSIYLTPIDKENITLNGLFYQSTNPKGVFYITNDNNTRRYYGVYGEGQDQRVIEPLPESLQYVNITNFCDHIVHSKNLIKPNNTIIFIPDETNDSLEYVKGQKNRTTPLKILYPKLLLIVDATYYTKFKTIFSIVRYLSIYWNIVGLSYAEVPSPEIKPLITGIIVAIDEYALLGTLINASSIVDSQMDINFTFTQYNSWVKYELTDQLSRFKNYDSTILMTNYFAYIGDVNITGYAETAWICKNGLAYICDSNMNFETMNIAVHEVGHLLGLGHDNETVLMNYENKTYLYPSVDIYSSWSNVSIKTFEIFAQKEIANCLGEPVIKSTIT